MSDKTTLPEILKSVKELTKDVSNIIGLVEKNVISALRISDQIQQRWEIRKLNKIIKEMEDLYRMQVGLPKSLRHIAKGIEHLRNEDKLEEIPEAKAHLSRDLFDVMDGVAHAREFLLNHHSKYMSRNPELYDKLISGILARETLLEATDSWEERLEISSRNVTLDENNLEDAYLLADSYQQLIDEMKSYRTALCEMADSL